MTRPVTSTSVATKGAEAVAGSKPMRWSRNGSIEPASDPKVTIPTSAAPTVAATFSPLLQSEEGRLIALVSYEVRRSGITNSLPVSLQTG